jgi:L-threonylcarbamoyladenylate synthase
MSPAGTARGVQPAGDHANQLEACIAAGGVALFYADTVYGLACDPESPDAVRRLYALKGRAPRKPSAVMWFSRGAALAALPELGGRTRGLLEQLLPGGVTALVPNVRRRFPLACGPDPDTLGIRVPDVPALATVPRPVLQSSANPAGGDDPRRLADVDPAIRAGADLVLDGGELVGLPSTVLDLRAFEARGEWSIVREGLVPASAIAAALGTLGNPSPLESRP